MKAAEVPYIDLLTPLVTFASRRIAATHGEKTEHHFTSRVLQSIHLQLAWNLSYHCAQTFHLEFQVFSNIIQSPLSRMLTCADKETPPDETLYLQFIEKMTGHGWRDFFAEYAVLAKTVSIILENWQLNTSVFIDRLDRDYPVIRQHFSTDESPGKLAGLKGGISDSHDHGKSVFSLEFETGLRLIYKPKNLELEKAWSEFLQWFNTHGLNPDLKPLDVITCDGYGWVGFIESKSCETAEEVADYYRRIGALVGIIYLLNGNDCHHENLIACGSYPVIVDLESVMHHDGRPFVEDFADSAVFRANALWGASVYRTGLLPAWITGKDGYVFDISGIGAYQHGASPYQRIIWEDLHTDRVGFKMVPVQFQELMNLPVLRGEKQLPVAYTSEIIEGFQILYRLLLQYRQEVPVHLFHDKELRFIFRSTRIYGMIRKKLLNPKFMRSGLDRSFQLELLSRAFLQAGETVTFWNIYRSEIRQMEEMDIPIFWAGSDFVDLIDNSGVVLQDYMNAAVYRSVVQRLSDLDADDMDRQVKFIRASLFFRDVGHGSPEPAPAIMPAQTTGSMPNTGKEPTGRTFKTGEHGVAGVDPEIQRSLAGEANRIAALLRSEAIFSKDGSCSWMSVGMVPGSEKYRMQPMSLFLYDGLAGVALFLSALCSITRDEETERLYRATMTSMRHLTGLQYQYPAFARMAPIGITSGIPSVIYALLKIGDFSGDPSCIEEAIRLSDLITPGMIGNDRAFDLMSGSAGCLTAMILLFKVTTFSGILEKAILCGDHLLRNAVVTANDGLGWKSGKDSMLTGFSHGAAGIAFALLRLFDATGQEKYKDAALKAILYENSQFSEIAGNWYDLRDGDWSEAAGKRFMVSWCHGAPGIGLGRAATLSLHDTRAVRADIVTALRTTLKAEGLNADHLCCGNSGRAEALLYPALRLKDWETAQEAYRLAFRIIERSKPTGSYQMFHQRGENFFNPGFFQGVSGIGYQMLRMAYPDKVPSVLAFE